MRTSRARTQPIQHRLMSLITVVANNPLTTRRAYFCEPSRECETVTFPYGFPAIG